MDHLPAETGCRLIIRNELRVVNTVPLRGQSLTIGRAGGCDIMLCHDAVSRRHARLEQRDDGWHIIDTGSVNGVRVNGQRVAEACLRPGDVAEIRPFALHYVAGPGEVDRSLTLAANCGPPTVSRSGREVGLVVKRRLEELYALSRLVIHRKDDGAFWQSVHAALQRSLAADRCVLVGVDKSAGFYRLAPRARPTNSSSPLEMSRSVLEEVVETGQGLLIQRVPDDKRFAAAESLSGNQVGSVLCAPVVVQEQVRAVVYADRRLGHLPFDPDDLDFVIAAMELAATAVGMDELEARARELSLVRGRLDAAREMQEMLLPSPVPQPAWGQVATRNVPAQQMSGDIYDVAIDGEGRLVVSIADVAGKGVVAAFATAVLQTTLRHALEHAEDLGEIMCEVNRALDVHSPTGCFATMVLCRWSADGASVEIANAGHHAPLWLTASGQVEAMPESVAMALGIMPDWVPAIITRSTSDDVALLLCSDGATEACDIKGELYGLSRVASRLAEIGRFPAERIIDELLAGLQGFSGTAEVADDVTLVVVRRRSGAGTGQ